MIKAKVEVENLQKVAKLPPKTKTLIKRCCLATLVQEEFKYNAEISVTFIDNKEIKILNNQYRKKNRETDVLSFPLSDNGVYDENPENGYKLLGDVVISLEKAIEQANLYGHSLTREIAFLTVHSVLHLLGYDHEISEEQAKIMRIKENKILTELGVTREYN